MVAHLAEAAATESTSDVLTAIGTVGATVLALTLALIGLFRGLATRPRLVIEIDPSSPPNQDHDLNVFRYVGDGTVGETAAGDRFGPGDSLPCAYVRARITSTRGRADGAEVVVLRALWWQKGAKQPVPLHIDGLSLYWSAYVAPDRRRRDLQPGLPRRIDIARVVQSRQTPNPPLEILVDFASNNGANVIRQGRVTLTLAVASNNGSAAFFEVDLIYTGTWERVQDGLGWPGLSLGQPKRLRRRKALRRLRQVRDDGPDTGDGGIGST